MYRLCVSVPVRLVARMDSLAERKGYTKSYIVREALKEFLKKYETNMGVVYRKEEES